MAQEPNEGTNLSIDIRDPEAPRDFGEVRYPWQIAGLPKSLCRILGFGNTSVQASVVDNKIQVRPIFRCFADVKQRWLFPISRDCASQPRKAPSLCGRIWF